MGPLLHITKAAAALAVALLALAPRDGNSASAVRQPADPLMPVGVIYEAATDASVRRRDLEEMQRSRFNILVLRHGPPAPAPNVLLLERLSAGEPAERAAIRLESTPAYIDVRALATSAALPLECWAALANGARAVVLDDWPSLRADPVALQGAAEFAGHVTRNAALYAAVRPIPDPARAVRVAATDASVRATFLESPDALVVLAFNRNSEPRQAVMTFPSGTPEAIWQNMLTGGAVNFVVGAEGPSYTYTFAPHGVLVLMIQKRWR